MEDKKPIRSFRDLDVYKITYEVSIVVMTKAESNETVVSLEQCKDIYGSLIDLTLCNELINIYDISGRQLYRLREAWGNFKTNELHPISKQVS